MQKESIEIERRGGRFFSKESFVKQNETRFHHHHHHHHLFPHSLFMLIPIIIIIIALLDLAFFQQQPFETVWV